MRIVRSTYDGHAIIDANKHDGHDTSPSPRVRLAANEVSRGADSGVCCGNCRRSRMSAWTYKVAIM